MADSASIMELHTALVDACKGYDEAIQDVEKPRLRTLFEKAKSMHEKAHAEIHAILNARAANPDDEGSFMSTVHKVVISTRAAVVGLDEGSLPSFASGEERIIEAYDRAIDGNADDGAVRSVLEQQKSFLIELVGEMQREAG
jgi:uncharacterized protein (TIGR02284 family)